MDGIYLYNKYGKPVTWEQWVSVREILGTTDDCNTLGTLANIGGRLCSHYMERYGGLLHTYVVVLNVMTDPDMSIWEVRNHKQNFVYSKIMLWVAFDRGIRLAEKRCLPCPNRAAWLAARDEIYEDIMTKGILNRPVTVLNC